MFNLAAAARLLAAQPANPGVLIALGMGLLSMGSYDSARKFAERSRCLVLQDAVSLFVLCLTAIRVNDAPRAARFRRQLICVAPAEERALYCAVWSSQTLIDAPDLLLTDSRRNEVYAWLVRSYAAVGCRAFNAWAIERYFHDRVTPEFMERLCGYLGKENNGDVWRQEPDGERRQYLMETNLTRFIGETVANNDCLHKLMVLGFLPPGDVNFLFDETQTANRAAFDLWSATTRFIDASALAKQAPERFVRLDAVVLPFGNKHYYKWVVFCLAQRLWERKRRSSLIEPTVRSRLQSRFEEFLGKIGWSRGDRVICFHVRENLYDRGSVNNVTQKFRNSTPNKFYKALLFLTALGYKIIRIGTSGSHIYPALPNYFDYANSSMKSQELDVAIMGSSDFYFGTDSGPVSVCYIFGRPVCVIDMTQVALGMGTGKCIYSPRLFRSRSIGRWLTMREMISQPFRYVRNQTTFDEHAIDLVESTENEICVVLQEFLQRFEQDSFLDEDTYEPRQRRVRQIFKRNKIVANGLMSERFLEAHPFLLEA